MSLCWWDEEILSRQHMERRRWTLWEQRVVAPSVEEPARYRANQESDGERGGFVPAELRTQAVCGFRYQERPGKILLEYYWLTTMLAQRGAGRAKGNSRAFDLHPGPQPPLWRTYVDRLDIKAAARKASRAAQEQSLTMRCKQTRKEGRVRQESQCEKNPRARMNRWMLT